MDAIGIGSFRPQGTAFTQGDSIMSGLPGLSTGTLEGGGDAQALGATSSIFGEDTIDPGILRALAGGNDESRAGTDLAFTPSGQYDHKKTAKKGDVTTTTYYGGLDDNTTVFKTVDTPAAQLRYRYDMKGGSEGMLSIDKETGTEKMRLPDGTEIVKYPDGTIKGKNDLGPMDADDAKSSWQFRRDDFDLPQKKQIPM